MAQQRSVADVLDPVSPSKLTCAGQCLAKFFFRYVERAPTGFRGMQQLGSAADAAANEAWRAKMRTGSAPPASDVAEMFAAEWDYAAGAVDEWEPGESRGAFLDVGTAGMRLWRDGVAEHAAPDAVQEKLTADVEDQPAGSKFRLTGVIDVRARLPAGPAGTVGDDVNTAPMVADLKVSRRAYSARDFCSSAQPPAYSLLAGIARFQYHVIVANKPPRLQVLGAVVTDDARASFLLRAGMLRRQVEHAARTGDWLPNRQHQLCSRRYCDHWRQCEQRFGGSVAP